MKTKRSLSFLLALVMVFSLMSISAFADGGEPWTDGQTPANNQIFYKGTDKVEPSDEMTNYNDENSEFDSVSGKGIMAFDSEISSIPGYAFEDNMDLTEMILPTSVTSIGGGLGRSFLGCSNLSSISMPGVTVIEERSFEGCESLTDVYMPEAVTIGSYAFTECFALKYVYAPASVADKMVIYNSDKEVDSNLCPITMSATNGTIALADADFEKVDGCVLYLKEGEEYTVTATPDVGYTLNSLTYTPAGGSAVDITNGQFTIGQFTMPSVATTVTATFTDNTIGEDYSLDLETDTENIPVSKTIDQYYTKTESSSTVYKNKIKVEWSNDTMNIKVADAKKWNPANLAWETDEAKNGVATVDGETNKTTYTLTNYSAKAFICNLTFAAEESQNAKFASYAVDATDVELAAVANDITQLGVTLDTSEPTTATITATITPKLTGEGSFAGADATTSAVKYGTFTISCTAVNN